jgi:hypothetical protein
VNISFPNGQPVAQLSKRDISRFREAQSLANALGALAPPAEIAGVATTAAESITALLNLVSEHDTVDTEEVKSDGK